MSIVTTGAVVVAIFAFTGALGWTPLFEAGVPERADMAAAMGATLALMLDAILPVPASLVIIGVGAVFPLVPALAIAFVGRVAMGLLCYALGSGGRRLVQRVAPPATLAAAQGMVERQGARAIVFSRPVPVLAESVIFVAGATALTPRRAVVAIALAAGVESVVYVSVGRLAAEVPLAAALWAALLVASVAYAIVASRRSDRSTPGRDRAACARGHPGGITRRTAHRRVDEPRA